MMSGPRTALLLVLGLAGLGFMLSPAKWPVSSKLATAAHADPGNGNGNQGGGGNNGNGNGNAGGNGNGNGNAGGNGNGNAGGNGNDNGNNGLHRALGHDKSAGDGDAGDDDAAPAETYDLAKVVDSVLPDHGERNRGNRRVVAHQLVVIEPAPDFAEKAGALGFAVLERRALASLGLSIMRLQLPAGMSGADGEQLLHAQFPGLEVDYNDLYEPQGTLSLPPPDYPRRQIGWGTPSPDCGTGQRIGLIDTPIDRRLPALAVAHIRQRDFAASFVTAAIVSELMAGLPPDRALLEKKLAAGAFDLGRVGRDPVFGWGPLQARPRCATANGGPVRDGA